MTQQQQQQQQHTPPPELMQQWITKARSQDYCSITEQVAFHAAQWGADQELEACCEWLAAHSYLNVSELIQAARRPAPKPPETIEVDGFTYRLVQ